MASLVTWQSRLSSVFISNASTISSTKEIWLRSNQELTSHVFNIQPTTFLSDSVNYNILLVSKGQTPQSSITTSLILKCNQLTIPTYLTCHPNNAQTFPLNEIPDSLQVYAASSPYGAFAGHSDMESLFFFFFFTSINYRSITVLTYPYIIISLYYYLAASCI